MYAVKSLVDKELVRAWVVSCERLDFCLANLCDEDSVKWMLDNSGLVIQKKLRNKVK